MKIKDSLKAELCKQELHYYMQQAWGVVEPGIDFIDNWHIEAISEYLEAVKLGQIKRLLINIPPRYMKSLAVTVFFPTWVWIQDPHKRFISLSYASMLSKKHNINRRDIIKSPWYQQNWGNKFKLKTDMDTQVKFENDHMGFMFATSIGGTLTGEGGDYIIVDDPHNPQQAQSDAERETANEFFKTTLPTRLNDKKKGAIIVVMQRLHEEDVSGLCLKSEGYEHLCLPAVAEKKQIIHFPISNKRKIREENDILWPQRESKEEIRQMKSILGQYGFSGQYQQDPSPADGGMVKRWWFRYWKPKGVETSPITVKKNDKRIEINAVELPDKFDMQIQSWDLNFKDSEGSDPVGAHVYGNKGANIFLLDRYNENVGFTETVKQFMKMTSKWKDTHLKLVEDKANGPAIIDVLQHKIGGIIPVKPEGDKKARLSAITPWIESGNLYLPHPDICPWVDEFIDQLTKFPRAAHDEDVDCCSQGLYRFIYSNDYEDEKKDTTFEDEFARKDSIVDSFFD